MKNWVIVTDDDPRYEVRIANVDQSHAERVLSDLASGQHGAHPAGLKLVVADSDFRPMGRLRRLISG